MAQTNLKQSPDQIFVASHSRSLSQPSFMANNCLPPLSPIPPNESSLASSNSNSKNMLEEIDVSSRGPSMGLTSPRENPFRGGGLPPRRGHRRSNSDVPLGFSAMIQSSPQLVPISSQGMLGQVGNRTEKSGNDIPVSYAKNYVEEMGERKSDEEVVDNLFETLMDLDRTSLNSCGGGANGGDSKNYESEVKTDTVVTPQYRHYRSVSMDSGIGNFHFGDSSPNLQNSRADQLSPSNSIGENSTDVNLDFGHGEFNEIEMKKIRADERLTEIAVSDPKRAKRILANRQSAARSKERKLRYISELEHKVQTLQKETTTLSTQITTVQKTHAEFTNQNNELKFRIHAMEQQAQLRDALHETLTAELQRLKLASMHLREGSRASNGVAQKHNMFPLQRQQQQPNQAQQLPVTTTSSSTTSLNN